MRYFFVVAIAVLLVLPALPASAATTVATDPCGGSPTYEEGVDLPGQDVCSVDVTTLTAGKDVATSVAITMNVAGDPQQVRGNYITAWSSGDCGFTLFYGDFTGDLGGPGFYMRVHCGERTTTCPTPLNVACETQSEYDEMFTVPGAFGPTSLTWTITFDDELAQFAEDHAVGDTMAFGISIAGPDVPGVETVPAMGSCGTDTPCSDPVGDWVMRMGDHTIEAAA